jgi:hypothetical protein
MGFARARWAEHDNVARLEEIGPRAERANFVTSTGLRVIVKVVQSLAPRESRRANAQLRARRRSSIHLTLEDRAEVVLVVPVVTAGLIGETTHALDNARSFQLRREKAHSFDGLSLRTHDSSAGSPKARS